MIEISNLYQGYKNSLLFENFSLSIKTHEITSIIGASGCGKSTLLKMLAGIVPYKRGMIKGVNKNCISMVFQEDRLLPWLTVKQNLSLVLDSKKHDVGSLIDEVLSTLDLKYCKNEPINELSGGMQRRVAIARALVYDKANKGDLILMDEPFKGLDHKLKYEVTENLAAEWRRYRKTVIMITHDYEEARRLSNNIIELYDKPVKSHLAVD